MADIKKKLLEQIEALEHELAHELPAEIKKAASLGDLSENAEYHMAKQRQEFVNARLGQFKKRMAELSLVNLANIPRDKAGFGSTVVVYDTTKDEEITYQLVMSEESDVTKGLISTTSPIGRGAQWQARAGDSQAAHHSRRRKRCSHRSLTELEKDERNDHLDQRLWPRLRLAA
jgi:transcription elongation factor GreA